MTKSRASVLPDVYENENRYNTRSNEYRTGRSPQPSIDVLFPMNNKTVTRDHSAVSGNTVDSVQSSAIVSSLLRKLTAEKIDSTAPQDEVAPKGPGHKSSDTGSHYIKGSTASSGSGQTASVPRLPEKHDNDSRTTARAFGGHSFTKQNGQVYDMVCVGFGPASLAIAIALADSYHAFPAENRRLPKILFLEKQDKFAWHAGMQLPEAKMQISYQKDLATPRDARSPFSFVNYLQSKGRFHNFVNLGTFLPSRLEYEDYLRWCASHFEQSVLYSSDVTRILPGPLNNSGKVGVFQVFWSHNGSDSVQNTFATHVVVAAGGQAFIPKDFLPFATGPVPRIMHSSRYATTVSKWEKLLEERSQAGRDLGELLLSASQGGVNP
jgi:hypothetical protein